MKTHGVVTVLAILLISIISTLPVSQHAEAQTADEMMAEIRQSYPVLQNPSFETGDFSNWTVTFTGAAPPRLATVVFGTTPDGQYFARAPDVTYEPDCSYTTLTSSFILKGKYLMYYIYWDLLLTYNYNYTNVFTTIYYFDIGRNCLGHIKFIDYHWKEANNLATNTWVLRIYNLEEKLTALWDTIAYMQISTMVDMHKSVGYYWWGGHIISKDGFYIGDTIPETRFLTLNSCNSQTVQSQYEFVSFWATNSFGMAINDIRITVENFPLKSLTVNCVGISGTLLGYHAVGEQKYIQLGIESPAPLGLYNVSVLFIYYDVYAQEIGRERFLIQVSNIAIQMNLDFDKEIYEKGQSSTLRVKNNMDRSVRVYIYAWYEASMFLYGDQQYSLATGAEKVFSLQLITEGRYTFEFRIYYEEVLQVRELRVRKIVSLVPANIYSNFATELWEVKGNSTLPYSFFTNSTELGNYTIYIRITYPDGSQAIQNRTVYSGLYEWYLPIPIPPVNYSQTQFKVEVFRKQNATADIQYGTGEYYQDGLKTWERTYTVYEGFKPLAIGWIEFESAWWWIIILLIAIPIVLLLLFAYGKRREKK